MADAQRKTTKEQPKAMSLFVPPDIRELAEQVQQAGEYGTLTNTLRVSLKTQLSKLTSTNHQPQPSAA